MANIGHGSSIKYGSTAATSSTAIANILSISGPNQTRAAVDITAMDSASGAMEFIAGLADPGETSFDLLFEGTSGGQYTTLNALYQGGSTNHFHISFADGANWYCKGVLTSLGHTIPLDDKMTASITIKHSGAPTVSAGT
jgi:hypothetical protein